MTSESDMRAATAVVVGGLSGFLIADVALMARDLAPETAVFRTLPGKAFTVAFTLHVFDVLGPFDPFRGLALTAGLLKRRLT